MKEARQININIDHDRFPALDTMCHAERCAYIDSFVQDILMYAQEEDRGLLSKL